MKEQFSIDFWLGKILEHVDLNNTILILTADHGERIPYGGLREVDFEPKLQNTVDFGKNFFQNQLIKSVANFYLMYESQWQKKN